MMGGLLWYVVVLIAVSQGIVSAHCAQIKPIRNLNRINADILSI